MNQKVLWLLSIAFSLGCVDLTPPWDKVHQAVDAACGGKPACASVKPTGGNSETGTGGSNLDRSTAIRPASAEPQDAPVGGGSAQTVNDGGSADAFVVGGQPATAGATGNCGMGGCGGSSGALDAGVGGTISTGGIVGSAGMGGSSGRSTGGAGPRGQPDAAVAGTIGTSGMGGKGGMGGLGGRSTGGAGSGGVQDAGAAGTGGMGGDGGIGGSNGGSTGGAGSGGSTTIACQELADCAPTKVCNSGTCVAAQGLVVLTVPFSTSGQNQRYWYPFSPAANLANKTVTLRVYAPDASAGLLSIYLSMANSASTAGSGVIVPLRDLRGAWKDITLNVGGVVGSFDPSQIKQVTIEVQSSDSGPWKNPTVITIDSIAIPTLTIGNTFDSSVGGFMQSSTQAIPGSTLTWSSALP